MDKEIGALPRGDVLVEGGRIEAIARRIEVSDADVIAASPCFTPHNIYLPTL